jgi:hypothetical protein
MIPAGSLLDQFSVALRRSPPASPRTGRAGGAIAVERIARMGAHISARLDRESTSGGLARVAGLPASRLSLLFKA